MTFPSLEMKSFFVAGWIIGMLGLPTALGAIGRTPVPPASVVVVVRTKETVPSAFVTRLRIVGGAFGPVAMATGPAGVDCGW